MKVTRDDTALFIEEWIAEQLHAVQMRGEIAPDFARIHLSEWGGLTRRLSAKIEYSGSKRHQDWFVVLFVACGCVRVYPAIDIGPNDIVFGNDETVEPVEVSVRPNEATTRVALRAALLQAAMHASHSVNGDAGTFVRAYLDLLTLDTPTSPPPVRERSVQEVIDDRIAGWPSSGPRIDARTGAPVGEAVVTSTSGGAEFKCGSIVAEVSVSNVMTLYMSHTPAKSLRIARGDREDLLKVVVLAAQAGAK